MFKKILGKTKISLNNENIINKEKNELIDIISKMNLTEMRSFVNNKERINQDGLVLILKKLLNKDKEEQSQSCSLYIDISDFDIKIKKNLDLIILIANNKNISIECVELIEEFIRRSKLIVENYDKKNKDIYKIKLMKSLENALNIIEQKFSPQSSSII